ncbi:MAG: NAD-dependent epimerase/dehydratase family protein [Patescibacteria group bacterium]
MDKRRKKILVTGGAGFIGSHITELLCDKGYTVAVVDDLRFGYRSFVDKRAKFFRIAIEDSEAIEKALAGVDVVMHLASSSIITFSYEHPIEYFENNLLNGIKLLEAMRKKGVGKIIYSSTSSVYGEPKKVPIKEDNPTNPLNAYAASKLAFEQALISYYHSFGIESVSLRYYNAYGPRDEQKPRTRAVPMWIEAILENKPIPWHWQGRQVRDYIYVKDVAQAHFDVLNLKGIYCFNIGSGKGVVMKDVLKTLEKIVGRKLKTQDLGERKGDPMKSFADISKIKTAVGWIPKVTLEDGLRETFEYYKNKKHEND